MSYNKIGIQTCGSLSLLISNNSFSLKEINLEGNKLGNKATLVLLKGCMSKGSSLTKLNLSKNQLTEEISSVIKEYLSNNRYILELYLHWNNFGPKGGQIIAEGLLENLYLKVLDISHNQLGQSIQCTKTWATVFQKDNGLDLIHVDFSFNNFTYEECKLIATSLENNHQICGFHFQGHYGTPDIKGFLLLPQNQQKDHELDEALIIQHRIDGIKVVKSNGLKDNCWICGGWEEKTFTWIPHTSGPGDQEPIFIHFSIDNYQPHLMIKQKEQFAFQKVFPPNIKISYFFTVLGNQLTANDQPREQAEDPDISIHFADITIQCLMEELNICHSQINQKLISKDYLSVYKCKPREQEIFYYMPKKEILQIDWSYENSLFKDWKKDDTDILDKCFNEDWNRSRIERIIRTKEEIPEFKEFLRSKYKDIKDCYKNYSSANPVQGEVWSISQNLYTEFVQIAKIVDNQTIYLKDSDFHFISTNAQQLAGSGVVLNKNNPTKQIIRHQFLELLVRLCDDKFIKNKKCPTYIDAFRQMLSDGLQDVFDSIDCEQDWRNDYYWTEKCDTCLRYYKPLIDYLYRKYAGSINEDYLVKIKYLNLNEFKSIFYSLGIINDTVTERDLNLAFNLSMMTQVDEVNRSRHLQMHVIEFMEALTRIADKLSPKPYGYEKESEKWSQDQLINLDLHIKIEGLLNLLFQQISDKSLRQQFNMPEKSIFDNEIYLINEGKSQQIQGRIAIQKKSKIFNVSNILRKTRVTRTISNLSNQSRERNNSKSIIKIQDSNNNNKSSDQQNTIRQRNSSKSNSKFFEKLSEFKTDSQQSMRDRQPSNSTKSGNNNNVSVFSNKKQSITSLIQNASIFQKSNITKSSINVVDGLEESKE